MKMSQAHKTGQGASRVTENLLDKEIKRPFLCLCDTISHALDPNESTISRSSMQDIQFSRLLETVCLASRFDKALCAIRGLSVCGRRKEEGRDDVRFHALSRAALATLF